MILSVDPPFQTELSHKLFDGLTFVAGIHCLQRIHLNEFSGPLRIGFNVFGNPLTLHLAQSLGQNLNDVCL